MRIRGGSNIPGPVGWRDEWHYDKKNVGHCEENGKTSPGVERRSPRSGGLVLQPKEPCPDEAYGVLVGDDSFVSLFRWGPTADPSPRIGGQANNKYVCVSYMVSTMPGRFGRGSTRLAGRQS